MKEYTEQKIASFQYKCHRWQLVKMTWKEISKDGEPAWMLLGHYQIRKDRKVICNTNWEGEAKHKFANIISNELNQLDLFS